MKQITLNGKVYKLELDYDGVEFLEDHFDMSLLKILQTVEMDRQKNTRTIYRALLLNNYPDLDDEGMKEIIMGAINKENLDALTIANTAVEAIMESKAMRKAQELGKEEQAKKKQQARNQLKKMNA